MRRCFAIVVCVSLASMVLGWWLARWRPPPCEVLDRGTVMVAPDSGWSARVRQEACGDGFFVTIVFTAVEVATDGGTGWRDIVRVAETDDVQPALAVQWEGARTLAVRVHAPRWTQLRPSEVPGLLLRVTTDAAKSR